jgi:hypothetical protein
MSNFARSSLSHGQLDCKSGVHGSRKKGRLAAAKLLLKCRAILVLQTALPLKGGAECFSLVDTQTLSFLDRSLREGAIQHILAILGLGICKEAKARAVLIEALVQPRFLIPTVLVVVDVVVGLGIGEVELHTSVWSATRRYHSVGTGPQYLVWSHANNISWWHTEARRRVWKTGWLIGMRGHLFALNESGCLD